MESIAKDEIDTLRDLPIRLGENDHIDGVTLTKRGTTRFMCEPVENMIRHVSVATTLPVLLNTMASFFKFPCGLLNALEKANLPEDRFYSQMPKSASST